MIEFDKNLIGEIEDFCKFNNIEDIQKEFNRILKIGFNVVKYGTSPFNKSLNIEHDEEKIEESKVPKKKVGRPKKVSTDSVQENVEEKQTLDEKENTISVKPIEQKRKVRIIKK